MSIKGMVSSRETIPDQKRPPNTDNFVKELLDALAEIMDKKVHLENENLELKHKCQSQKQKIEAFKELALGEKAFLLGIIKRECCSACPGRQHHDVCNSSSREHPVKENAGDVRFDKRTSTYSAGRSDFATGESEALIEKKASEDDSVNDCCAGCPARNDSGDVKVDQKVSARAPVSDQQNQTEEIEEV